ncbi:MAG: hypothetical protein R3B69_04505 [Candidatus Paceibacterota bacterium]
MYRPERTVLATGYDHEEECYWNRIETLTSNGTYQRRSNGDIIQFPAKGEGLTCFFRQGGEACMCHVANQTLVNNIVYYLDNYYNKCFTNCSAFAHFATTGDWVDCLPKKGNLVLEHPMHSYQCGQKVRVGDVLCLLYAFDKPSRSRRLQILRSAFLKCQKARNDTGEFTSGAGLKKSIHMPQDIRDIYEKLPNRDYHFMVCIGSHHGKPVWLSQRGYQKPGENGVPFVITVGNRDPYEEYVPVFTFIRRMK